MLRVVVGRWATLKADQKKNCRAHTAQDGCLVIRPPDRGPRLQDGRHTVDGSREATADSSGERLGIGHVDARSERTRWPEGITDTHVDAHWTSGWDGGSNPPASTTNKNGLVQVDDLGEGTLLNGRLGLHQPSRGSIPSLLATFTQPTKFLRRAS